MQLRDGKTLKYIMISTLGVAVLYMYFLTTWVPFTYKASAAVIKDLSGRYGEMSSEITKARQTLNSLPYLEKESQLLHSKWDKAQKLLPNEDASAAFLRAVTLLGDNCGVEFVTFHPLPPQAAQYYTEHPIELKVEGGYNEIGTFLGQLANMERIVTISDLSISGIDGPTVDKPASASFIAKTFTLGGTGVAPEDGAGAVESGKPGAPAVPVRAGRPGAVNAAKAAAVKEGGHRPEADNE